MHSSRTITVVIRGLFALLMVAGVFGYAYSRSQDFRAGPQISILEPTHGQTVTEQLLRVHGSTENISDITLNGRKIYITEDNIFDEVVLLYPGYNTVSLTARDRFQKQTTKNLIVVYDEQDKSEFIN